MSISKSRTYSFLFRYLWSQWLEEPRGKCFSLRHWVFCLIMLKIISQEAAHLQWRIFYSKLTVTFWVWKETRLGEEGEGEDWTQHRDARGTPALPLPAPSALGLWMASSVWSFEFQLRCHLRKEGLLQPPCAWQLLRWLLTVTVFKEGREIIFKRFPKEKKFTTV